MAGGIVQAAIGYRTASMPVAPVARQSKLRSHTLLLGLIYSPLSIGNLTANGCAGRGKFLNDSGLNGEIDWKCPVTYTSSSAAPSIKKGILGYANKIG
jgi:hypothetical protein